MRSIKAKMALSNDGPHQRGGVSVMILHLRLTSYHFVKRGRQLPLCLFFQPIAITYCFLCKENIQRIGYSVRPHGVFGLYVAKIVAQGVLAFREPGLDCSELEFH